MDPSDKPPLSSLLGPGGPLARTLPGYELREPQLQMALRVEAALAEGRALCAEAGTGTGKSLAYLIPAARSGLKVVISTATKNLQEQLKEKDVPILSALGIQSQVVFLKGRQNYLCKLRAEQFLAEPTFQTREEARQQKAIERWVDRTETGDKAELTALPEGAEVFAQLTSTADTCTGQKCPHYDACFLFKMRRRAAEADVVVVNHHLFFADLALRSSSAGDLGAGVLPRYDAVIFDEAHAVPEVATEHFGAQASSRRAEELGRDALAALEELPSRSQAQDAAARLEKEGSRFFARALELHLAQGGGERRALPAPLQSGRGARSGAGGSGVRPGPQQSDRWTLTSEELALAEPERQELLELLRSLGAGLSPRDGEEGGDSAEEGGEALALLERRCSQLGRDLELFGPQSLGQGGSEGDGLVRWAEARGGHSFLHASPLDIGPRLQSMLYDRVGPLVFTSATLAVSGSLAYFARSVGLADQDGPLYPLEELVVSSPFDYERHAALYLPQGLPEPQAPEFVSAVADELRGLLPLTGGCAFALFTSLKNMRACHELLARELERQGLRVLLQGEAPKGELLRRFKEKPSVLFASQSFWEGVDVPGEALRLVVIDKLPFASPFEPLVAARIAELSRQGAEPFTSYQVPQAALALKQGFGRLIRSSTDRGVVAVLDPRLLTKGYGRTFLATLPRCAVLRTLAEVQRFWEDRRGAVAPVTPVAPSPGPRAPAR